MGVAATLAVAGLALNIVGALLLTYGSRPRRRPWSEAEMGFPNPLAWQGFALLALGNAL